MVWSISWTDTFGCHRFHHTQQLFSLLTMNYRALTCTVSWERTPNSSHWRLSAPACRFRTTADVPLRRPHKKAQSNFVTKSSLRIWSWDSSPALGQALLDQKRLHDLRRWRCDNRNHRTIHQTNVRSAAIHPRAYARGIPRHTLNSPKTDTLPERLRLIRL